MIPRYQRILFWSLVAGILLMAAFLLHGCEQAHKRLSASYDATPIAAPTTASTEDITLYLASDADASITPATESARPPPGAQPPRPRPPRPPPRHLLPPQLRPPAPGRPCRRRRLPPHRSGTSYRRTARPASRHQPPRRLHRQPPLRHPGRSPHRAIHHRHPPRRPPAVTAIRFLVDGQPHDTLAGHADLLRTYPATDTTAKPITPIETPATP